MKLMKTEVTTRQGTVKIGSHILIVNMIGEKTYTGRVGTVDHIDDKGQISGSWGGCRLIPGYDDFKILNDEEYKKVCDQYKPSNIEISQKP